MIRRKWIGQLKQILKEKSGKEPTMTIKDINSVYGKIRDTL